jgi:hypothetical protein
MSWSLVRPYFKDKLEALNYAEWPDGFNFENIPANLLDHCYHITLGGFSGLKANHTDLDTQSVVTVRMFSKGYNDPALGIDNAIADCEAFVKSCVNVISRATTTGILNVVFSELVLDPLGPSNDNAIMATLTFNVRVILSVGP